MCNPQTIFSRLLLMAVLAGYGMACRAQDALPAATKAQRASEAPAAIVTPESGAADARPQLELNVDNLLGVLEAYGVKHKEIVCAQAILETGHFTSQVCMEKNNLFGLRRPSDGSYFEFDCWQESVRAYRDDVQYKYAGGDYYAFLRHIGYAEDRRYTDKVRRIEQRLTSMAPAPATPATAQGMGES